MINWAIPLSSFAIDHRPWASLFTKPRLADSRQSGQTVQVWVGKTPKTVKYPQSFATPTFPIAWPTPKVPATGVAAEEMILRLAME